MSWFKSEAPVFQQLLNLGLILSIALDFFFLNTMNMADLNSGHTLGILVTIFMILCSISYFTLNKEKPGHSLAFSNFMTASKSIFAPASLVFSLIILIVYIADKVPTPWEYVLPTHLFLTTCYLFHDSEFQTKPWVPILKEIEYNMNKQPSSILRMLPIDEGGDHYMTTENFQVVLGQTKRLDPKFTAYLVKDEIHTRRKAYSILNRALLLGLRNQPTSLSITNLAKLEQRGSAHLLIMHLFRENPNEVYNLSRIIKSRNRVKYTLTNEQYTGDRDSIILVHNWSLTQVKNTAELLLDAILAKNTMQEDAPFSDLFHFHFAKLPDNHGAKFLVAYLILLSGDSEPEQHDNQWLNFNLAFAFVARRVWSSQSNVFRCNNSGKLRRKHVQDLIEKIIAIRESPVENFIEIHDQVVEEIKRVNLSGDEGATMIQQTYLKEVLDEVMNNMVKNLFNVSGDEKNNRISTKNSRKEIVAGTSVGLYCMLDMLRGDKNGK